MKALFFDAGPIITLIMSRMGYVLPMLKTIYGGKFYITPAVKYELVDRPLGIRKYQFEALQVLRLIREGILEVYEDVPNNKVKSYFKLANKSFYLGKKSIDLIQEGEMQSLVCAKECGADGIVMDERTLRLLVEEDEAMVSLLERRFNRSVNCKKDNLNLFKEKVKDVKILRSIELISVAYKKGFFDMYEPNIEKGRDKLIEAILWTAKYNGCAVTDQEVEQIKRLIF
jgi:hypothetical protein